MVMTVAHARVTPGGTVTPRAPDAVELVVPEGPAVQVRGRFGKPERESVTTFRLGGLQHPRLRLRAPLTLSVTWADSLVSVLHEPTQLWGEGGHLTAAVEDFQRTLAELYLGLQEDQGHLGPALAEEWAALQQWIEERP